MRLIIYTDGASRGNPGRASYGFLILNEGSKILYEEGKYLGIQTNNFAEYSAVLAAMEYVIRNFKDINALEFYLDSQLVTEQLSGRYKIKSSNIKLLAEKVKNLSKRFPIVKFTHIPRYKNKRADKLANMALD